MRTFWLSAMFVLATLSFAAAGEGEKPSGYLQNWAELAKEGAGEKNEPAGERERPEVHIFLHARLFRVPAPWLLSWREKMIILGEPKEGAGDLPFAARFRTITEARYFVQELLQDEGKGVQLASPFFLLNEGVITEYNITGHDGAGKPFPANDTEGIGPFANADEPGLHVRARATTEDIRLVKMDFRFRLIESFGQLGEEGAKESAADALPWSLEKGTAFSATIPDGATLLVAGLDTLLFPDKAEQAPAMVTCLSVKAELMLNPEIKKAENADGTP